MRLALPLLSLAVFAPAQGIPQEVFDWTTHHLRLSLDLRNQGDRPQQDMRLQVPVPQNAAEQRILRAQWSCDGKALAMPRGKNGKGAALATYAVPPLVPGAKARFVLSVDVRLASTVSCWLSPRRLGAVTIDGAQQPALSWLRALPGRAQAQAGPAATDWLLVSKMQTEVQAAGLKARPVVGVLLDKAEATADFAHWLEIQLPGAGWVPVDPRWGQAERGRTFPPGQAPGKCLVLCRGAGARFFRLQPSGPGIHVHSAAHPRPAQVPAMFKLENARAATRSNPPAHASYAKTSARSSTRIFYWGADTRPGRSLSGGYSQGQVHIDHGLPRWNPKFYELMQRLAGKPLRFGQDAWTSLESNMDLVFDGDHAVPRGRSYLNLIYHEGAEGGRFELCLSDPAKVRAQRLDAYQSYRLTGGQRIPLKLISADAQKLAPVLNINLSVDLGDRNRGRLRIAFGPYRLGVDFAMKPEDVRR